jgi:hypothetical protein
MALPKIGVGGNQSAVGGAVGKVSDNFGGAAPTSGTGTGALPPITGLGGAPTAVTGAGGTTAATGTGGMAATTMAGSVFPPSVTKPRIMIVGDSISAGPGCYKKYLVQNLKDNGITNYEFIGEYTDDCGGGVRHSAVSCSTAAQFTLESFTMSNCSVGTVFMGMTALVKKHNPDMIMIQLGVNDIWSGNTPVNSVLANYAKLVQQARAQNPNVVVLVAQIHKIKTEKCTNAASYTNAEALAKAVPDWTKTLTTASSPVLPADLWTNSDETQSDDCVHPNDEGAKRMGLNWYNAIKSLLH